MASSAEHVEERWRALREASPQRSPFSRLDYLRAAADAAGLQLSVHFVQDDQHDSAGAAVTWTRRGPYRITVVPPYTPFSALLLRETAHPSDVHARSSPFGAILRELERQYDAVQLHLHPSLADVRPAIWRGWDARPLYTYVRPLDSGDVLAQWSGSTARNFRNTREAYELVEGPEAAEATVVLSEMSYTRHGRSAPLSREAVMRFVAKTDGFNSSYAVRRRDDAARIEAGAVILSDAERSHYWIAGSIPGNAMTVLVGEILTRLSATPVQLFDFVGANTPTIAEFKRKFGCHLETYYRIVYYGRRDLELLYVLRGLLRGKRRGYL